MSKTHTGKTALFHFLRHKAEESAAGVPALKAAAEKAATSILTGEHAQKKPGTGEKFWQYREYVPGDALQDIDWRASAKGDRLFIKQKEWQTTQTALFWTQNDTNMGYASGKDLPTKRDTAITIALGLAILMAQAGEHIADIAGMMKPGRTDYAIDKLGEALLLDRTPPLPVADTASIRKNSNLVLIGDFLAPTDETEQTFKTLASRTESGLVIQVLDPAELSLPFNGRIIFENETDTKEHIRNVESIRRQYQERINTHTKDIKTLCRKNGWHWVLHSTDTLVRDTLFDAWVMLSHKQGSTRLERSSGG